MTEFPDPPNLRLVEPNWYELQEDYRYRWDSEGCGARSSLVVRRGFCCDLASVPRLIWPLIGPQSLSLGPPLIHDAVYACQGKIEDYDWLEWTIKYEKSSSLWYNAIGNMRRVRADKILYNQMINAGVPEYKATPVYYAVRLWGSYAWRKTRDGDKKYGEE